jgi:hypothetical protein
MRGIFITFLSSSFVNVNISILSSKTTGPIETKLGRNVYWVSVYNVVFFNWKSKKWEFPICQNGIFCIQNFKKYIKNEKSN